MSDTGKGSSINLVRAKFSRQQSSFLTTTIGPNMAFSSETEALLARPQTERADNQYMESVSERILELEAEILALRRRRNYGSPINRLPPEILSKIFLAVQARKPVHSRRRRGAVGVKDYWIEWFWVSHVCEYWRNVALGCVELWSNITDAALQRPHLADALVARSRDSPLVVKLKPLHHTSQLAQIVSQIHRIRSLKVYDISDHGGTRKDVMMPFFVGQSAPRLERLRLSTHTRHPHVLSLDFLSGGCPSLKSLGLNCYSIPDWKVLPLGSRLTDLSLSCLERDEQQYKPPMAEILGSLGEMKGLKHLNLDRILPTDLVPGQRLDVTVALPNLRLLRLWDLTDRLTVFIQHLRFPKSTEVCLRITTRPNGNIKTLLQTLTESWNGARVEKDGVVELDVNSRMLDTKFSVRHVKFDGYYDVHAPHIPKFRLKFADEGRRPLVIAPTVLSPDEVSSWSFVNCLEDMARYLDFTTLRKLSIDDCDPLPDAIWDFWGRKADLEHINIQSSEIDSFLEWICDDRGIVDARAWLAAHPGWTPPNSQAATGGSDLSIEGPPRPSKLPSLSKLELRYIHYRRRRGEGYRIMPILLSALELRASAGCKVDNLKVKRCNWFTQEDYERWSMVCPSTDVQWEPVKERDRDLSDSDDDSDDDEDEEDDDDDGFESEGDDSADDGDDEEPEGEGEGSEDEDDDDDEDWPSEEDENDDDVEWSDWDDED